MSAALPACSGVFVRAHCRHPRLFEEEYKRSNRNRGTKILRCFPHCCPHHVDRSYCGSSLEVDLHFGSDSQPAAHDQFRDALEAAASPEPFSVDNVFVFARFETADGAKPPAGAYSLRYLRSVSQSEVNPEASWIEGVQQTAAATQQHSQQLHGHKPAAAAATSSEPPDRATFVLNGQAFAKWYYHWESGANKVQRATKHVLRAYVFYRLTDTQTVEGASHQRYQEQVLDAADPADAGRLELLCVVSSPPFTVVSYRRAPLEATAGGVGALDVASALLPNYSTDGGQPVDSRLRRLVQHQISRAFREYNQQHMQGVRGGDSKHDGFVPLGTSRPGGERDDEQLERDEMERYHRYRQLQQREGLSFRLLTPEDAARSGSPLHEQIASRQPRLVFDSMRRGRHRHWRDSSQGDDAYEDAEAYEEDEVDGDAQPWTATHKPEPRYVPSISNVSRTLEDADMLAAKNVSANLFLARFQQQQRQLDRHPRELAQLSELATLHWFASHVWTVNRGSDALAVSIIQFWRHASGGAGHLANLLIAVAGEELESSQMSRTGSETAQTTARREELLHVLSGVCVWVFSPENLGLVQGLLTACHPLLLDDADQSASADTRASSLGGGPDDGGLELRLTFLECVARCYEALDAFLQSGQLLQTNLCTVRGLSDAVLGVVFSDQQFETLRDELRAELQRPAFLLTRDREADPGADVPDLASPRCNLAGWRGFVAQVREGYLREKCAGRGLSWTPPEDEGSRRSRWTGEWLLQPGSLTVSPRSMQTRAMGDTQWRGQSPSIWTACLALSQLLHLHLVAVGEPLHTLYMQAEPSVLPHQSAWLRLICDGRVRVASVAPNGMASLLGGSPRIFGGDYVAYRSEQQGESTPGTESSSGNGSNDGGPGTTVTGASQITGGGDGSNARRGVASSGGPMRLEFYWWPHGAPLSDAQESRPEAFRVVLCLKAASSGAYLEAQMNLERGLVDPEALAAAQSPRLELWPPMQRVQSVAAWHTWQSVQGIYARS